MATADGTAQVIDVTINGANDAAVITGDEHGGADRDQCGAVDRRRPRCHRRGQLGDLRGAEQRGRQHGYGKFSIDAAGTWTYTMDGAHDEFVGGTDYTDSITVATADGTSQVITVTMHGTNDARASR